MSDDRRFDRDDLERYAASAQATSPPKQKRLTLTSVLAMAGGNAADAASTIYALTHGAREANPALGSHPSAATVIAVKGGATLAEVLAMKALATKHPKLANGIAKGIGAGMGAIAIHNARHARAR